MLNNLYCFFFIFSTGSCEMTYEENVYVSKTKCEVINKTKKNNLYIFIRLSLKLDKLLKGKQTALKH